MGLWNYAFYTGPVYFSSLSMNIQRSLCSPKKEHEKLDNLQFRDMYSINESKVCSHTTISRFSDLLI